MTRPDRDPLLVSRREVLQAAAALVPLGWAGGAMVPLVPQSPLVELGAREAVQRIRAGELRAEAYFTALIGQYHAYRGLNAVNWISETRVLEAARAVDQARSKGAKLGALAGLPVAIKDQIAVAGYPSTGGNGALKGHIPKRNAAVVETLVRAGAIPFCMAACPDMTVIDGLMHQIFSHSPSFGAVRNPYDPTRGPGGSSGGNGALLAARIVPAAIGEDTNGSIRLPSSFSGVAGLRPSTFTLENAARGTFRKRYSDDGLLLPPAGRLDTIGPMARTAEDVAFLDAIITGETAPAIDPRSIRIGIPSPEYWDGESVDPGVATVMQEAFAKLRDAGCHLVELDFNGEVRAIVGTLDNPTAVTTIGAVGLNAPLGYTAESVGKWLAENSPDVTVEQMYRDRPMRRGSLIPPNLPSTEEQIRIVTEGARRYAEIFQSKGISAIAFPTVPIPAIALHPGKPIEPFGRTITIKRTPLEEGKVILENLFVAPRMGAAGLVLPAGMTRGLPVGMELDAQPGRDSEVLGVGVAIEKILGRIPGPSFSR